MSRQKPEVAYGLTFVCISEPYRMRLRCYVDGLTVFEKARRNGDGWGRWQIEFSEWFSDEDQLAVISEFEADGFVGEEP